MELEPTEMASQDGRSGYLDDVLTVFERFRHPFVLVEEEAMRWMGIRVGLIDVS